MRKYYGTHSETIMEKGSTFWVRLILLICLSLSLSPFFSTTLASAETEGQTDERRYRIGPSDVLNIFVWKEPELTQDLNVMPDGRITFPLIGEIVAEGKTVTELKDAISEKLKEFISAPEVTVIVKQSRSQTVYLIGKVSRPGPIVLLSDMTVLQVLSTAGGFAEWADEKNILIVRREGQMETRIPFNYKEFISGKNPESNILLKPGDTIVVP